MRLILSDNNSMLWLNHSPPRCALPLLPTVAYVRVVPLVFPPAQSAQMERLLKRMGQPMDPGGFKRTLELNRDHPVVKKLAELQKPMRTSRRSKHTRGCC